jgi:hypothetical protein
MTKPAWPEGARNVTASPDTVNLPGQVWGLAAASPAGPLYVTSYTGRGPGTDHLNTTMLTAVDLTGAIIWQRTFDSHPFPPRVDTDGTVWVAHQDGGSPPGFAFTAVGPDGTVVRSVTPQQEPPERLGAVVRMPDGFCAVWLPTAPRHQVDNGVARLARYSDAGNTTWSTPLPLATISYPGAVEAGDVTGWQVRPKRAWRPSTLIVNSREPLLVAGDRILVGIQDYGSGIGVAPSSTLRLE